MKRFVLIMIAALCAQVLIAGKLDKVVARISNVSTTTTVSVYTTRKVTGYLNRVDFGFLTNTAVVYFTLVASNTFTGATYTMPVASELATNTSYHFTNYTQRVSFYDEAFKLSATTDVVQAQDIIATIFFDRP